MRLLFWILVIFGTELAQSYFADRRTVEIVKRKKWRATIFDVIAEGLGWLAIVLIVVNMSLPLIMSAVVGNALGTYLVASRKKKKTTYRRKFPVSTA